MPTNFTASGEPNRSGPKGRVLILPILGTASYLLLTALSRSNLRFNMPFRVDQRSPAVRAELREMVTAVKALVALMTAYLSWSMINVALGKSEGLGRTFVPLLSVATFGIVFIYISRLRKFKQ